MALVAAKLASLATGAALAVGITAAVVLFGLHLLYQQQRAAFLVLRPPAQAALGLVVEVDASGDQHDEDRCGDPVDDQAEWPWRFNLAQRIELIHADASPS